MLSFMDIISFFFNSLNVFLLLTQNLLLNGTDSLFSYQIQVFSFHLSFRLLSPLLQSFNETHVNSSPYTSLIHLHVLFNFQSFLSNDITKIALFKHEVVIELAICWRKDLTVFIVFLHIGTQDIQGLLFGHWHFTEWLDRRYLSFLSTSTSSAITSISTQIP